MDFRMSGGQIPVISWLNCGLSHSSFCHRSKTEQESRKLFALSGLQEKKSTSLFYRYLVRGLLAAFFNTSSMAEHFFLCGIWRDWPKIWSWKISMCKSRNDDIPAGVEVWTLPRSSALGFLVKYEMSWPGQNKFCSYSCQFEQMNTFLGSCRVLQITQITVWWSIWHVLL